MFVSLEGIISMVGISQQERFSILSELYLLYKVIIGVTDSRVNEYWVYSAIKK